MGQGHEGPMGVVLNLSVFSGGQLVGQHAFDSDKNRTVKIGRLGTAQLRLEDPSVARIHAVIEFAGGDVSLVDMGSQSGTIVNGKRAPKVKLKHGDQVTIGNTMMVIGLGAPPPMPAGYALAGADPDVTQVDFNPPMTMQGHQVGAEAHSGSMPAAVAGPVTTGPVPAIAEVDTAVMAQAGIEAKAFGGQPPGQAQQPVAMAAGGAMAAAVQAPAAAPGAMPGLQGASAGAALGPRFDGGGAAEPIRRISQEQLAAAAVESRPHPGLPPEKPLSPDNRILEMRIYWGQVLLAMHHFNKPKRITIGEAKNTDVFISSEGLPVEVFPLIRYIDGEYVLTFSNGMEGEVEIDGNTIPLATLRGSSMATRDDELEGSYQIRLPLKARGLVHWGGATFAVRFVPPSPPPASPFLKNLDLAFVNTLVISLFLHLTTVVALKVYPYDTDALRVDLFDDVDDRFGDIILQGPKETASTKDLLAKLQKTVEEKKQKLQEPEKVRELPTTANKIKRTSKPVKTKQQRQAEVAKKFAKMFGGGGGSSGAGSLLGGGGGGSLAGTLSNVIGTAGKGSASQGIAGLGIRGSGPMTGGGIGTSRGIAGIGTAGRLGGGGLGYGAGVGIGKKRDRGMIELSTPVVMGALAQEVIKRVINQNKQQVRYCYEVELQKNQKLEGRLMMSWIIAATGAVAKVSVKESTMRNRAVERCVMSKIRKWKFPPPAGGGIVEVNYPFVFRAG